MAERRGYRSSQIEHREVPDETSHRIASRTRAPSIEGESEVSTEMPLSASRPRFGKLRVLRRRRAHPPPPSLAPTPAGAPEVRPSLTSAPSGGWTPAGLPFAYKFYGRRSLRLACFIPTNGGHDAVRPGATLRRSPAASCASPGRVSSRGCARRCPGLAPRPISWALPDPLERGEELLGRRQAQCGQPLRRTPSCRSA
jgi:hypothetical protein